MSSRAAAVCGPERAPVGRLIGVILSGRFLAAPPWHSYISSALLDIRALVPLNFPDRSRICDTYSRAASLPAFFVLAARSSTLRRFVGDIDLLLGFHGCFLMLVDGANWAR